MRKGNLIKLAAPAILSAAMMVSGLPVGVMAADFTEGSAVEVSADEFTATEDDFGSDETTPFVDEDQAAEDEFAATAAKESYKYVYAGLSWEQFWASEGVYNATNTDANAETDAKGELDKGGFDTVTRATANHGLHRGSFQCIATIYDENGGTYQISHWTDGGKTIVLTDGSTVAFERGTITKADGTSVMMEHYEIYGMKYIPVAVKAEDYDAFKQQYSVVETGGTVVGGYGEQSLVEYSKTAEVTADTNGLKTAEKNADGTFSFEARKTGSGSGIQGEAQKTVSDVTVGLTAAEKAESYGAFIRADINGNYGDLGSNMYAVKWTYYGNSDTPLATYGTKFAADNWMHKSMGIQLGLTDSYRCQLPAGTDGTGKWVITVYAMGYADYSFEVNATEENIVKSADDTEISTDALQAAIEKAETLKEEDYTKESWSAFQMELDEAKEEIAAPHSQATVDEALSHLTAAMDSLVEAEKTTVTFAKTSVTLYKGKTATQTATVTGSDAAVVYTSSNTKVATVNKSTGKVTAKAAGKAVITAKCGDVTAKYTVNVKNPTLKLSKTSASVKVGKTTKITAKATPSGKVTYKSSNKKVATVSSKGVVKGIKKGTAKITVTCNGVSKTFKVTVK